MVKYLNSVSTSCWLTTLSLIFLFHAPGVPAREVTFAWDTNTEPILGGYRLYYGPASRSYTSVIDVGNQTIYTVSGLADDTMYYVATTAYDTTKTIESAYSNEVVVGPSCHLDVDGNGQAVALEDGLLISRYEFGFRGATLTAGAVGAGCTRCTAAAIETYLVQCEASKTTDIDGNNKVVALEDGLLISRYEFGFRGATLTTGAVGAGCTRCTAAAIESYLGGLIP